MTRVEVSSGRPPVEQERDSREREPEREPGSSSSRNASKVDVVRRLERNFSPFVGGHTGYDEPTFLESAALLAAAAVNSMAEQIDGLQTATSQRHAHLDGQQDELVFADGTHERNTFGVRVALREPYNAPDAPKALEAIDSLEAIEPFDEITEMC